MKCLIIYFSLTGNTKKIAQAIYAGIKETAEACDIVTLKDARNHELSGYDLIGLGSPVHFYEPANVRNFIKRMAPLKGKHFFVFCTHATRPEAFFPSIIGALQNRGAVVTGKGRWYGSHNDQQFPCPYPTDGHPDEIDLGEAREFGRQMVERSRRISSGEEQLIPEFPVGRRIGMQLAEKVLNAAVGDMSHIPPHLNFKHGSRKQPKFKEQAKLNIQKCTYPECTLCVGNCPMDGIDLSVSPPRFAEPCMNCYFCEKICPHGAIESDFKEAAETWRWRTEHIYMPLLDKAEAEGRFRRLVPAEKVGLDTPYYKVHSKHPRYMIT